MKSGNYIVGSVDRRTGRTSVSANPVEHTNVSIARGEAERLAQNDTNKEFVVLQVVGSVVATSVAWK